MPKKPTEDFGVLSFGKDGSVRKEMSRLSDHKAEQEIEVGQRFSALIDAQYSVRQLPENDHDFELAKPGEKPIIVQAAEISGREYLRRIPTEVWAEGKSGYTNVQMSGPNEIYGIDEGVMHSLVLRRIVEKKEKHYAKPAAAQLWLLIWCVESTFPFVFSQGGRSRKMPAVELAEAYLERVGFGPFDAIWVFNLLTRPYRLCSK